MKKIITITALSLLFFAQCTTINKLSGTYTDTNNMEFKFNDSNKKFEYFFRSGMGVLQYSKGNWQINNHKLYLQGLSDQNIKMIDVECAINNNVNGGKTQVELHWSNDEAVNNIRSAIVINNNKIYMASRDTVFTLDYIVEVIQVKSYLFYSGLLSSPPKIDTLYSSKINISRGNESKNLVLKFTVHPYDFARIKFSDTLSVKNNRTLYLNKTRLKKVTH